jgi:glycosyltransferase involved in cell wall biosynthesis
LYKNIVFLTHPYHRGGVTQWMASAFNEWNKNLCKATFLTINPTKTFISAPNRPLIKSLLNVDFLQNCHTVEAGLFFELGTMKYRANTYRKLVSEHTLQGEPIIPSDDEACWMAAATCGSRNPMIAVLHSDEEEYFRLAEKYQQYVTLFVCVSKRILNKLQERIPESAAYATAIPCGIPVNNFSAIIEKKEVISWIGRLSKYQKRAQDILPLFESLLKQRPNVQMEVIGNGDYSTILAQEIIDVNLQDKMDLMGWVDNIEISTRLSYSKLLVQTSDFEGTSVAMMEALASGCCIVSTRVSGVEDLEHLPEAEGVVFLYEPGNVSQGVEKINLALENFKEECSGKSKVLASKYFDCFTNLTQILNYLNGLPKGRLIKAGYPYIFSYTVISSYIIALLRLLKWKLLRNAVIKP